jgi:sphinganine-1-phosphate aldolase
MFDFRISGVSSLNVDLHKVNNVNIKFLSSHNPQYGYCPVGSSAILYRDLELLHSQSYCNINWSGGIYSSQTLDGDARSGLLIALTWASLLYYGRLGYVERSQRILDTSLMLKKRLEEISDLQILGETFGPVMALISTNSKLPIHALGDEMNELGWSFAYLQVNTLYKILLINVLPTYIQHPNALRLSISLHQTKGDVIDSFIGDLKKCCEKILSDSHYEYPAKTVN